MTAYGAFHVTTSSPEETEALGRGLAAMVSLGTVVGLYGDLASGKTCFVRGFASYFDVGGAVHSPTFTLINRYCAEPALYHVDLYRLEGVEEVLDLGIEELFESAAVCLVEWAERAGDALPVSHVKARFEHAGPTSRHVIIEDYGALPEGWNSALPPPPLA
ncbi:MAG: tRNA (adenosine(37)-N6)-threonylcarbamoyltransferase complex ATPase subunit type 1 TsaE [Candidatus Hydrogenedentota bacterium]